MREEAGGWEEGGRKKGMGAGTARGDWPGGRWDAPPSGVEWPGAGTGPAERGPTGGRQRCGRWSSGRGRAAAAAPRARSSRRRPPPTNRSHSAVRRGRRRRVAGRGGGRAGPLFSGGPHPINTPRPPRLGSTRRRTSQSTTACVKYPRPGADRDTPRPTAAASTRPCRAHAAAAFPHHFRCGLRRRPRPPAPPRPRPSPFPAPPPAASLPRPPAPLPPPLRPPVVFHRR